MVAFIKCFNYYYRDWRFLFVSAVFYFFFSFHFFYAAFLFSYLRALREVELILRLFFLLVLFRKKERENLFFARLKKSTQFQTYKRRPIRSVLERLHILRHKKWSCSQNVEGKRHNKNDINYIPKCVRLCELY